ncbi:MAG: hypothetical protein Ct9H300mP21_01370 [Pseudomonadota bacterium]|nr:MAG: hypothetical protein Ct9H300mP21_01370 [Pseudomonadota bacterium]
MKAAGINPAANSFGPDGRQKILLMQLLFWPQKRLRTLPELFHVNGGMY